MQLAMKFKYLKGIFDGVGVGYKENSFVYHNHIIKPCGSFVAYATATNIMICGVRDSTEGQ